MVKEDNADDHPHVSNSMVEATCLTCDSRRVPPSPAPGGLFDVSFMDVMISI